MANIRQHRREPGEERLVKLVSVTNEMCVLGYDENTVLTVDCGENV